MLDSVLLVVTLAVLVRKVWVPTTGAVTVTTMATVPPGPSVPTFRVWVWPLGGGQEGSGGKVPFREYWHPVIVMPAGNVSVMVALAALATPALTMPVAYVTVPPLATGSGSSR